MDVDYYINQAIIELDKCDKHYIMFKDLSFIKNLDTEDYNKVKHLLKKSSPFEEHTAGAIKFSKIGFDIISNHKDWYSYKKSLRPKRDIWKAVSAMCAIIIVVLTFLNYIGPNRKSVLLKENDSLKIQVNYLELELLKLNEEMAQEDSTSILN